MTIRPGSRVQILLAQERREALLSYRRIVRDAVERPHVEPDATDMRHVLNVLGKTPRDLDQDVELLARAAQLRAEADESDAQAAIATANEQLADAERELAEAHERLAAAQQKHAAARGASSTAQDLLRQRRAVAAEALQLEIELEQQGLGFEGTSQRAYHEQVAADARRLQDHKDQMAAGEAAAAAEAEAMAQVLFEQGAVPWRPAGVDTVVRRFGGVGALREGDPLAADDPRPPAFEVSPDGSLAPVAHEAAE